MDILQKKLDYEDGSLDFRDFKQVGIHGIAKYPAMMVAPIQEKILVDILKVEENITNILDPFHGSGTTLVVGKQLGLETIGIDINPLANLFTEVKLTGVEKTTIQDKNNCLEKRLNKSYKLHKFTNIDKWFRADIIEDLSKVKSAISKEKDYITRRYYWLCMSNIVYKYKNSRKSTFKLHIKKEEDIAGLSNNVLKDFINEINNQYKYLPDYNPNSTHTLFSMDVREACKQIDKESIDVICTSPPYGDNATTVTYGQFSILSLLWVDEKDLNIGNSNLLETFSKIDYLSLGGKSTSNLEWNIYILNTILSKVSKQKQKKIISFFQDYFESLINIINTLRSKGIIMLTLGNRTVDGEVIELDNITEEFLKKHGFKLITNFKRNIYNKRMPSRVSSVDGRGSVNSMSQETILVFRKG